jgi:hypothetical protein
MPRPADLEKFFASHQQYYSGMHSKMRTMDKLYEREFETVMRLPQGVPVHRSSTPTLMVDELRDQIRADEPLVTARLFGRTREKLRDTQQMWGQGVLKQAAKEGLVNPFAQARHDLLLRGAGAVKWAVKQAYVAEVDFEGDELEEHNQGLLDGLPFSLRAVDPLLLYPSTGPGPLRYMVEMQERRLQDMQRMFPDWTDPLRAKVHDSQKDDPLRTVKWLEYWSWEYYDGLWQGRYILMADGEELRDDPNPYGQIPYSYRYSGLGRVNEDGDPAKLAVGVLEQASGEIEAEIRIKTAMDFQWQAHIFPIILAGGGITAEELRDKLSIGPGAVVDVPDVSNIKWLEREAPNQQMMNFLDQIRININKKVSPALSGERTADFGIHQALQIGQAIKVISPVRDSLNNLTADMLDKLSDLMVRFDLSMNVHGTVGGADTTRTVGPSDFSKHNFEVSFEAVDPSENDRRMLAGLSVKNAGDLMSAQTYREKFLKEVIVDNEEEEARLLAEVMLQQAVTSGALMPIMMQIFQMNKEQEVDAEATQTATSGLQQAAQEVPGVPGIEALAGTGILEMGEQSQVAGQTQGGI